MKIYILPTSPLLRPDSQIMQYPAHNADYGVEQDFLAYLNNNRQIITENPVEAEWHYLPVFWTRWHLNKNYGREGVEELQRYVDGIILDDARTFTMCQYDDGPLVDLGQVVQFLASRKTGQGIDIPLLCTHHRKPLFTPKKKFRAAFVGRLCTHPLREEMAEILKDRIDVAIYNGDIGTRAYVKTVLQSRLALAPRGYGGSSFRFYEAMQLGIAPVLIGDIDTRPFKKFIPWHEVSIFVRNINELNAALDEKNDGELAVMGDRADNLFRNHLTFQKWCPYVLKELQEAV